MAVTTLTRPIFRLDFLGLLPVVIKVEPHADPEAVQTAVWDLACARAVQVDKEALAAEYERSADEADRDGRAPDAKIFRDFASEMLTQARDLLLVLQGAEHKAAA